MRNIFVSVAEGRMGPMIFVLTIRKAISGEIPNLSIKAKKKMEIQLNIKVSLDI